MQQHTIQLTAGVARNPQVRLAAPASLDLLDGEHLAIVGPNAGGKSIFVDLLTGRYPLLRGEALRYDFRPSQTATAYENIKHLTFKDVTYCSQEGNYYYQQRWNHTEQEDFPIVSELLGECRDEALKQHLFELFHVSPLLDKKIILLSSGELRKFQLTKTLLTAPRILILDNPFIGLDATARRQLAEVLAQLAGESVQIILVLSRLDDIPPFITHVLPVEGLLVGEKMSRETYLHLFGRQEEQRRVEENRLLEALRRRILELPYTHTNFTGREVVRLNKVSIRYGERTILKELDWLVCRGERWALSGENGSGKSTLLSLVCADNPQSYACDIALFGRKRGSGESIWEIKKHIGYVSPEMHRAYLKNLPAIEIVASGLHDTVGLYKRPRPEEFAVCEWWMDIFGVAHLKDKLFLQLSSGEQRLCLLARAFVKDPELLILDEPLHGLDTYNRRRVKHIIEAFCDRQDKTLIMVTHYEDELPENITNRIYLKRN
ncbi:MAG: ATP-binding cassette domain-containing protein [Bacteroides sp.]|nr:ATP-binding cassette domain-containing protein [Bacteroides sp.]